MNRTSLVQSDERTVSVENAGYRWAYVIVTYALLIDVAVRGLIYDEAAWDLMAFVIFGGIFCTFYQWRKNTLVQGWIRTIVIISVAAAIVAAAVASWIEGVRG